MRRIASLLVFVLLLVACGGTTADSGSDETGTDGPPAITGQTDERVQAIADLLNYEADQSDDPARAAIRVTYAERVDHYRADGSVHYGVHYIVSIATDAGEPEALDVAEDVAARIFQLTTEHVFETHPVITHMGVQIIDPDAWFIGGHDKGSLRFYVASREALERVAAQPVATPQSFLNVANASSVSGGGNQP